MAIDMCSERSPRILFSHDNAQTGVGRHVERFRPHPDSFLLDTNSDFTFCVDHTDEHKPSTADELFSNGIILPIQIQERTHSYSEKFRKHESHHPTFSYLSLPPLPSNTPENSKRESLRELLMVNEADERPQPKKEVSSFWGFKRSASLNCDSSYKISLICSLPLLSRSNSTGSMAHSKKSRHKQGSASVARSSSSSSSSSSSTSSSQNKTPLKKSYENSGVPPCISKGTHTTRSVCFNLTV